MTCVRSGRILLGMITADDELVIRHTRFCECGKPAGHRSVCRRAETDPDGIRVDHVIEEQLAERAHGRFARRKREFDSDRRLQFAAMDTLQLHRWVAQHAVALSTVAGGSVEPSRGSSDGTPPPPRQQQLDDDPRYRENERIIRKRLEQQAELMLEQQGHSTVGSTMNMIGAEKDALILSRENEGLRAQAVVDRLGTHIAGSARTVQRVRAAAHLDHLGHPRTDDRSVDGSV